MPKDLWGESIGYQNEIIRLQQDKVKLQDEVRGLKQGVRDALDKGGVETLAEARHEQALTVAFEFVSDWVAEVAEKDDGKVFWNDIPNDCLATVTYGDLRRLMRSDQDVRDRFMAQKEADDG